MLPVFSVILEYRMDGRDSCDKPTVRSYIVFVLHVHSALSPFQSKPKHVHLYSVEPYQLQLIKEHAFRKAQMLSRYKEIEITYFADFQYIHKQRNYSMLL